MVCRRYSRVCSGSIVVVTTVFNVEEVVTISIGMRIRIRIGRCLTVAIATGCYQHKPRDGMNIGQLYELQSPVTGISGL